MKKALTLYLGILFSAIPALFAFAGCHKESNNNQATTPVITPTPPPPMTMDTAKKYLALGDSYTIGQNVDPAARFPAQIVAILSPTIKISNPEYIATTGWTTINLMDAIKSAKLTPPYDVVSLLIGVNDQYQGKDTAGYRTRFIELLNKSVELAGNRPSRVFVVSIPDYSATPFVAASNKQRVSMEVDGFNAINKQETLKMNISYTDITPSSREAATNPSLVANDGLHPSGSEYMKWAAMLAPKMMEVLK